MPNDRSSEFDRDNLLPRVGPVFSPEPGDFANASIGESFARKLVRSGSEPVVTTKVYEIDDKAKKEFEQKIKAREAELLKPKIKIDSI